MVVEFWGNGPCLLVRVSLITVNMKRLRAIARIDESVVAAKRKTGVCMWPQGMTRDGVPRQGYDLKDYLRH